MQHNMYVMVSTLDGLEYSSQLFIERGEDTASDKLFNELWRLKRTGQAPEFKVIYMSSGEVMHLTQWAIYKQREMRACESCPPSYTHRTGHGRGDETNMTETCQFCKGKRWVTG